MMSLPLTSTTRQRVVIEASACSWLVLVLLGIVTCWRVVLVFCG